MFSPQLKICMFTAFFIAVQTMAMPVAAQFLTGYKPTAANEATEDENKPDDLYVETPQTNEYHFDSAPQNRAQNRRINLQERETKEQQPPVDLDADNLVHDDKRQIITATGNVILVQANRSVKADRIRYFIREDKVIAEGNVIVFDENGDTHFAERVELNNVLKEGFIYGLQSYLSGGGRFTAEKAERLDRHVIMTDAAYTPCDCETDEDGEPAWQIRADELIYDEQENRVSYKNAKFEIFGIPVAWLPFMSHPDGQVKRKSGLLAPGVGFDSKLGLMVEQSYYWDIAPNRDATMGLLLTSQELPVALAEYRHRFENASLVLDGSVTYAGRTDSVAGQDVAKDDELRGHLFADALWDINDKWRAGVDLELSSDDQYLRQYDFSSEDVLENEIYAERFSGRHYAVGRVLAFQDVRVREERSDQPNVLPEIITSFVGEPNALIGGRWKINVSALGLQREGDGQDMTRAVLETNWQRRFESDYGLLTTADLNLRGDVYYNRDREIATTSSGRSGEAKKMRGFAQAHIVSSYPMAREFENMQAVIEPMVALTVAPNIKVNENDIPNEDSQDVQLDASNLFNANRFPGKDRIEDDSRITYGMKTGLYGYDGSHINAFVGQSYRLDEGDNPFPEGSGLSRQESDFVGQLSADYKNSYGFNYRFQMDSAMFTAQRHEFDGYAHWDRFRLNTRYLYAEALEGTDIDESREQIDTSAAYDITSKWRLRTRGLYDLGEDPGLRKAGVGVDYFGCCLSFSLNAQRSLTTESSGDSGTDITFRIGLKNIGEFQTNNKSQIEARNR